MNIDGANMLIIVQLIVGAWLSYKLACWNDARNERLDQEAAE